ncbi:MAG TPA: alanine--glyoxylate aminotransferase family protein [Firmicutes bacterium]|nr:alanine--glyoxylate aminotransferase family protein [Bacillota bacterium]
MQGKQHLFIPGPTPVPPEVAAAMAQPLIGHRSSEFASLQRSLVEQVKQIFQTKNDLFILTSSGTGAMEAAVASSIKPGERVLALVSGHFGNRFAAIAERWGAQVERLESTWGEPNDLEAVKDALSRGARPRAVLATHNETSTGVVNDIARLGALLKDTPTLLLVDAVSSMGAMDIRTDAWGVDFMITSSQKAFMLPPGLAFLSVSPKAWQAVEATPPRSFYFDLRAWRQSGAKGFSPWTPGIALLYGLEAALKRLLAEGLPAVWARHQRYARLVRAGLKGMGLTLLAADAWASATVTAARTPGVDPDAVRALARREYGLSLAGGKGKLAGEILRFSHMGYVDELELLGALAVLEVALARLGFPVEPGAGVAAAEQELLAGGGERG